MRAVWCVILQPVRVLATPSRAAQEAWGLDDGYGTLAQIRGIARLVPQTQLLEIADCGHSPHRDQPQALIDAATAFIHSHNIRNGDTA